MNPDHSGLFAIKVTKLYKQKREQTAIVVNSEKRV